MFEVGGLLKNQILFIFLFNTYVLRNGIPLATFGLRKVGVQCPLSLIILREAMVQQILFLESLRVHKLKTSSSTVASRVVLGQNFIQEGLVARVSVCHQQQFLLYISPWCECR
ncbi:uncharacterized protein TM35_002661000 [Trypanosoma theileri]|uniref:Uncharacterized protein n=1 Tax=Trypanosoma theileri TaxID=67003 RepID=A0A1X0NES7_9TRYP|nr:uncharacterized protein TM35_002661000 [Trypanosoma theileri]ORC77520.1 hypothetical protein TM35_002661000 [Trypanosoma theileri]